jgi:hypothetical protein
MNDSEVTLREILSHILGRHPNYQDLGKSFEDAVRSAVNKRIVEELSAFCPMNGGPYDLVAPLTSLAINQIFPLLAMLPSEAGRDLLGVTQIEQPGLTGGDNEAALLKDRLDFYGSDKATLHDYHSVYAAILQDRSAVKNIFEIGLGTNNIDRIGTMGAAGRPGASLRAFRDFCPNANVFGADVDESILFTEERILTYHVDQTRIETFDLIKPDLPVGDFDLVIDDGLHAPNANVASLIFGLSILSPGGWLVIEDIGHQAFPIWQVVARLLPSRYRTYAFRDKVGALIFLVRT